jgi:uncharacterized membrane protein (DUF485 family)
MKHFPYSLSVVCVFLWIGFVCAISFMEAWIKFQAPGITLALGLGIGQLVFAALNKMEWLFTLLIFFSLIWNYVAFAKIRFWLPFGLAFMLLLIQTTWLLPALQERAQLILTAQPLSNSNHHWFYILFEVIKVTCLMVVGISLLNLMKR